MTAVGMLRQSGFVEMLTGFVSPLAEKIGFPPEVLPLAFLRPFSGSGALGYYSEICESVPVGSFAEKVASVLMGGSETTFYTIAVYFGSCGITKTKHTIIAALCADVAAVIFSIAFVNLLL